MKRRIMFLAVVCGALLLSVSFPAQAYVGPGAGISLLGALWALIAVIGSAILYVVLWPLRRIRKRRRQDDTSEQSRQVSTGETSDSDAEAKENER